MPDPTPDAIPTQPIVPNIVQVAAQLFAENVGLPSPAGFRIVTHNQPDGSLMFSLLIIKAGGDITHVVFDPDGFKKLAYQILELLGEKPSGLVVADGSVLTGLNREQRRHNGGG